MQFNSVVALTALALCPQAWGFLRFSCSELVIDRLDPVVTPGQNPSNHVHQITGGDAFNVTMDPGIDIPQESSCTSCTFSENFSNYWTSNLYFQARNGSLMRVPQMGNHFLEGANGGMTIYYIPPEDGTKVTAFAPGFRMLVGDPNLRSEHFSMESFSMNYRCLEAGFANSMDQSQAAIAADSRHLPTRPCPGGIRSNIFFPTCWDGVNLDSPNHKSHVAYPSNGFGFGATGNCPASHPVRLPQLFLEVVWDTRQFNDPDLWPEDGSQPFLLSQGDPTGYGQHADYVFGWKGDALQRAMDANCDIFCPQLTSQVLQDANRCTIPPLVPEEVDGWMNELPGDNPIRK